MTVRELMEILAQYDENAVIRVQGDGGPEIEVEEVNINRQGDVVIG